MPSLAPAIHSILALHPTNHNSYLDVWDNAAGGGKVNQSQYEDIVLQQLEELWGNYGALAEICV